MNDLDRAAARARQLTEKKFPGDPGVGDLLAVAANRETARDERAAALRLLGALVGEALVGPRIVHLDIVGACNSNCIYCRDHSPYINDREPWRAMEMPYELAARLIDEAVALGAEIIPVVGAGENLLHSRFFDLVNLLKTKPLRFEVFTNGLDWDDAAIDLFAEADNALVAFSLSACTAETWAAFRPEAAPESFARIERTMRRLIARRRAGMKVAVVHVLNKLNVREVLPLVRHAIDLGADELQFKLTEINEAARSLKLDAPEIESIRLELREARRLAALAGVDIHDNIEFQLEHLDPETGLYTVGLYDELPCHAGFEMIRVRRDGQISFCCGLKFLSDAREVSLAEHWLGDEMRACRAAALAMPRGANRRLPDGGLLRDPQCDYCYNYILNVHAQRRAQAAGAARLLPGKA